MMIELLDHRIPFGLLHLGSLCLVSAVLLFGLCQSSPPSRGDGQQLSWDDPSWQPHHNHHADRLTYSSSNSYLEISGPYIEPGVGSSSPHHPVNISAQDGSNAYLPCTVKRLGSKSVSWIRKSDGYLLTVDRDTFIGDKRFQALHLQASDTWTLHIRNVQPDDAGIYECQVSSEPKTSLLFQLHVVTPHVEIKGSPEIYVNSGSHQVELHCLLTEVLEEPPFIFWYYDDRRLLIDSAGDVQQDRPAAAQPWAFDDESSVTASPDTGGSYEEDQLNYGLNQDGNNKGAGSNGDSDTDTGSSSSVIRKTKSQPPNGRRRYKEPSIKSTDIIRLQPGTILSRLTIFHPSPDDSGKYQCRPSNLASANVTLHVLDGEHEEPAAAVQSDGTNSSPSSVHWRFCISSVLAVMTTTSMLVSYV